MVLIFVDKDSNMNMTKGALILSLSFLLAACSSIPQNIKGNNQPDIQKSFVAVHNQPRQIFSPSAARLICQRWQRVSI